MNNEDELDTEAAAIDAIMFALKGLDDDARQRVLKYVYERCEMKYGWSDRHLLALANDINESAVGKKAIEEHAAAKQRIAELEREVASLRPAVVGPA